jgi:protein-S-isoprenylcysteine O-methyltransferase Ste14
VRGESHWKAASNTAAVPAGVNGHPGPANRARQEVARRALETWLGAILGVVVYCGSRMFSPGEEAELARTFEPAWDDYRRKVRIP